MSNLTGCSLRLEKYSSLMFCRPRDSKAVRVSVDEHMNEYMLIYEFSTAVETVLNLASFMKI